MFVIAHSVGWFIKALILRDPWMLWIISIMFEVMEYSLEHQLPNFAECWWDHWIMDVFTCNWLGLWLGIKACKYFNLKLYSWKSIKYGKLNSKPNNAEKDSILDRILCKTFWGYVIVICVVSLILIDELNLFYLKAILWIPQSHAIIFWRTLLHAFIGSVAVNETYTYSVGK